MFLHECACAILHPWKLRPCSKQRRSVLTLEKMIEIIREIEKGKSQRRVAEIFELPKSTAGDIWKDREKISCHVFGAEDPTVTKHKIMWIQLI